MIDGRLQVIRSDGTPRRRAIEARYLHGFVEEMKTTGFVAEALACSHQPDAGGD